jgi:hypothetical protein
MAAKISVRKMGTRQGQPHYGAECQTCGSVLAVAHLSRDAAKALGAEHRKTGCQPTLRFAHNAARDGAHLRTPRDMRDGQDLRYVSAEDIAREWNA